jgi:hypothetical protein
LCRQFDLYCLVLSLPVRCLLLECCLPKLPSNSPSLGSSNSPSLGFWHQPILSFVVFPHPLPPRLFPFHLIRHLSLGLYILRIPPLDDVPFWTRG